MPTPFHALALGLVLLLLQGLPPPEESESPPPEVHEVASPDGSLVLRLSTGPESTYSIIWNGMEVVSPSEISMKLADGTVMGPGGKISRVRREAVDRTLSPVVPEKRARIRDHYAALSLDFHGDWGIDLRAYDNGVAFRFRLDRSGPTLVEQERFTATLGSHAQVWFPEEESVLTHSERLYRELALSEIQMEQMASLPVLTSIPGGPKILITESDLREYPGLYLRGTGGGSLKGVLPAFPRAEEQTRDRTVRVTEREDHLARISGPRTFPWRILLVAGEDRGLVESTLVYQLAPPNRIQDTRWIRPGKVAWDWWNASSLHGVGFESGLNTETYLYFVDFAADHGIEYVILDEGWSDPADLTALNPEMDLDAILARGRQRGVGIILWVVWKTLADQMETALDRFADLGVAGIKVDFMQRDDQPMVEFYWEVAHEAARRHLLVDFHGSYKPSGLRRAYPNVLTREGVLGLEHSKWSTHPTPDHNVTLPFIRMVAGPMDYTPGAMRNAQPERFSPVFDRPMSLGTRAHQMAMYVVFESPLQMLADSPSNYLDEPECLDFISRIPTVWDETRVLAGQVGEWIAIARRRGDTWYLGIMTGTSPREIEVDLSFLGEGHWHMDAFRDGPNAHRNAEDYTWETRVLENGKTLAVPLAAGGGWVARLSRIVSNAHDDLVGESP